MEFYNQDFLQQLAPLIVVERPELIPGDVIKQLSLNFEKSSISKSYWDNSIIKNRLLSTKYIIEYVSNEEEQYKLISIHKNKNQSEHSINSPFNLKSDLFPNGILSRKWFDKYLKDLPFAFITISELPDNPEEDLELSSRLLSLKNKYHQNNIKFITILVTDSVDPEEDDDRVNKLRQLTNLPKLSGILHLHNSPKTLQRDSEILVASLLSNLKNAATDFYSGIEYKIKQRNKKYYSCPSTKDIETSIELTPDFLETRNMIKQAMIHQLTYPHNLESSIKLLELSYEHVILLLRDIAGTLYSSNEVFQHDIELFKQIRNLIDILAFHIVRGYLSIEEPALALRKHQAHITNVLDIISYDRNLKSNNNWLSIQYQWIAELMNLVPKSLMFNVHSKAFRKKAKNMKLIEFYGGIKFLDQFRFDVFTNPGFLYLKAAGLLSSNTSKFQSQLSFLEYVDDVSVIAKRKIELLKHSKEAFKYIETDSKSNNGDENQNEYHNFTNYINWLVAEEYMNLGNEQYNMENAIRFYQDILVENASESNVPALGSWFKFSSLIYQKLLNCFFVIGDTKGILSTVISLSLVSKSPKYVIATPIPLLNAFKEDNLQLDLEGRQFNFFDLDVLLVDEGSKNNETFVYDNITTQLVFNPKVNLEVLRSLIQDDISSILLKINSVEVLHSISLNDVILYNAKGINGPKILQNKIEFNKKSNNMEGKVGLEFDSQNPIVIQYSQRADRAGMYLVQSIKLTPSIEIVSKGRTITLNKTERLVFDEIENTRSLYSHHKNFYSIPHSSESVHGINDLLTSSIRLSNKLSHCIKISPLKPDVSVTMSANNLNSIILGEKIILPFSINYTSPKQHKFECESIFLSLKVSIVSNQKDADLGDLMTFRNNWESLKDDEVLNLKELVDQEGGSKSQKLFLSIHCSPQNRIKIQQNSYRVVIDLKTIVHYSGIEDTKNDNAYENDQMSIYDTASYTFPIINEPFESKFVISPRYRSGNGISDMPNPFVLLESPTSQEQNHSMPIATRFWMGKLELADNFSTYDREKNEKLKIILCSFQIKSKNPGLIIDLVEEAQKKKEYVINQYFTTRSKHGMTHRNVSLVVTALVKWCRENNQDTVNEFESEDWEIVLPLSDPRVLMDLERDGDAEDRVKLKYVLENPTPRIFTFSTQMVENAEDEEVSWKFDDERNETPLKQAPFAVLAFTRHAMNFYSQYSCPELSPEKIRVVRLPQFRVLDVDYKISLPSLSVNEQVLIENNTLYWHKNI